jgi:uncharacterized protein (DUF362 family)
MNRREFLKTSLLMAVLGTIWGKFRLFAAPVIGNKKAKSGAAVDLVAVKNGTPGEMTKKALAQLGGMKAFVKPGQHVVIKPNIGWDQTPETGADTNPEVVATLVAEAKAAGAAKVTVFDYTCDRKWQSCYERSGIKKAVEAAGGKMACGNNLSDYKTVNVPKAISMKKPLVHKLILEADVFINVPVLKHHGGAQMTCALKNFMGLVWDRRFMHQNNLNQCIADAGLIRRPDLNVVDAYRVMISGGPTGRSPKTKVRTIKCLLASRDIVAIDTASAALLGTPVNKIGYIALAQKHNLGTMDLKKLNIKRLS